MPADPRSLVATSLCSVFALVGAIHFYWALGGSRGRHLAVPERGGRPVFDPGRKATFLVGVLLLASGLLVLARAHLLGLPGAPFRIPTQILSVLLLLRAIGDFRFVGFFKRVRGTPFAFWDTWLFSPLSFALGAGCAFLAAS
jgi:hypothetical protein